MKWKIPLFKIYWDEEDIKAVTNVIRRGTYWATGPEIKEFEKKILSLVEKNSERPQIPKEIETQETEPKKPKKRDIYREPIK